MNPYLNILKGKKGLTPALSKLTEAPYAPFEPNRGSPISERDTPFEPYEPRVGSPFLEIATPSEPFEPAGGTPVSEINVPSPMDYQADLVREFMEVDGLSREEAEALAAVSEQPRPAAEWLAMISELDGLIECYCRRYRLSSDAQARMLALRNRQSLSSIPDTLQWFRDELADHDGNPERNRP